jgi:hypothetical protein
MDYFSLFELQKVCFVAKDIRAWCSQRRSPPRLCTMPTNEIAIIRLFGIEQIEAGTKKKRKFSGLIGQKVCLLNSGIPGEKGPTSSQTDCRLSLKSRTSPSFISLTCVALIATPPMLLDFCTGASSGINSQRCALPRCPPISALSGVQCLFSFFWNDNSLSYWWVHQNLSGCSNRVLADGCSQRQTLPKMRTITMNEIMARRLWGIEQIRAGTRERR